MNLSMEFSRKVSLAYGEACKPLCRELNLPQTAFDILLFLANNPAYSTAADIVEIRKIKANLVSVNVDKLVRDGYLPGRGRRPAQDPALLHGEGTAYHPTGAAIAGGVSGAAVPRDRPCDKGDIFENSDRDE